jgi:hypothetical protein
VQEFDCKQIGSNAKLSDFTDIDVRAVNNVIKITITKPASRVEEVEVQR